MTFPRLYALPGLPDDLPATLRIDGTALAVPKLDPAQVERVWRSLDGGAGGWRQRALDVRLDAIAAVAQSLRSIKARAWRQALARSSGLSDAGLDAAWETTFAAVTREALTELLQHERLDETTLRGLERSGHVPRRLVQILSGNVFPAALNVMLRAWVLGSAQWLRPSTREPLFACCVWSELQRLEPQLAGSMAVLWWPHDVDTETEAAILAGAEVITAQGDDDSVATLGAKAERLAPAARFLGYGTRWSGAVVASGAPLHPTAAALARDVALFDQQGCLSPTMIFVQRDADPAAWSVALAEALAVQEASMPRGPSSPRGDAAIRAWRERMRLGIALGSVEALIESPGATTWGVARLRRCGFVDSPLERHVVVAPFADVGEIADAVGTRRASLQGLALALDGWSAAEERQLRDALRPSRVAPPGTLQCAPPSWSQDHRPPLRSLMLR